MAEDKLFEEITRKVLHLVALAEVAFFRVDLKSSFTFTFYGLLAVQLSLYENKTLPS